MAHAAASASPGLHKLNVVLFLVAALWTGLLGLSLAWSIRIDRAHTRDLVEKEARANFDKDVAFRLWATRHGGVYVPANARTPPNPNLAHVPERDIVTPSGRRLTLMNPAYMLRQLMQEYGQEYGIKGRITSLKQLNPDNAPDNWEREALHAFEKGAKEASAIVDIDGQPHLRLMRPLVTNAGCLKCHRQQGYQVGDVRGGVGVAVPMAPYLALEREGVRRDWLVHGGIWLLGLFGLGAAGLNGRRHIRAAAAAAEAINRLNAELEGRVRERTAQLEAANGDLVTARDAAEAANRAKSVFLANMSHELRTPLNAILGFSELMRREVGASEAQRQTLAVIQHSGNHLLKLINDVLEIAKIEAGRTELQPAPFDLGALILEVTEMLRLRATDKGLQLLVDQSSLFPRYIVGDEAKLRQILINLLSNAVKATEAGGITLRLGTQAERPGQLVMEVEDTGIGIAPEDQARIFEAFVQVGAPDRQHGTGLGLAITRQFVELMGGRIGLTSTVGQGSTFRVELPVHAASPEELPPVEMPREVVGLAPGQPAWRVLVAEDQAENRLLMTRLLEGLGFTVATVEDGAQAVSLFQQWHPDFICMDRRMPEMDGIEATRRIRALPGGDAVKIAAVTASSFREEDDKLSEAGFDAIVHKPFRPEQICQVMHELLGVRFTYAGSAPEPADSGRIDLSALPPRQRERLAQATQMLDMEAAQAIVAELGAEFPGQARQVAELLDGYRWDELARLCEGG